MILIEDFDIRYSEMQDLSFLQEWFTDSASLDAYPFNEKEKDEALKNWIGFAKYKASLTGTIGGKPCAIGTLFLMPYRKVAHHCSFYLIVDPMHRRKGVGHSMVRNLVHLAKTRFRLESVQAELYEPSQLYSTLNKLGFELVFTQENYLKVGGVGRSRHLLEHFIA